VFESIISQYVSLPPQICEMRRYDTTIRLVTLELINPTANINSEKFSIFDVMMTYIITILNQKQLTSANMMSLKI